MKNLISIFKSFITKYSNALKKSVCFVSYSLILVFLFVLIVNLNIVANTNDNIYSVDELIKLDEDFDCILVLGAGVKSDGTPTHMLYDRLMVAYDAYAADKSSILFLSGDSEHIDYTETVTMKNVLNEKSVQDSFIVSDGYGLSTYESIWRAKNVYEYDRILIVSQKYHLNRAIYIANKMGIEAYGLDGALREYGKQPIFSLREYFARIKDMIFSEIYPDPTYTEEWGDING